MNTVIPKEGDTYFVSVQFKNFDNEVRHTDSVDDIIASSATLEECKTETADVIRDMLPDGFDEKPTIAFLEVKVVSVTVNAEDLVSTEVS